jgi:SAM-dependent methyltransferase
MSTAPRTIDQHWYEPGKFFDGHFYATGDDTIEGHLEEHLTLEQRTAIEVEGIMRLLRLKAGDQLLDMPCGYGRHSIALAKRGFSVMGGDINPEHLAMAKERAVIEHANVRFDLTDMLTMRYRAEFNAAINMFLSFGFLPTDEENEQVARNFYNALMPGGTFLMHTDANVPRILAGQYKLDEVRHIRDTGKLLRIHEQYDEKVKRLNGVWDIDGITKEYSVRLYDRDEFTALCRRVGFRHCEAYSDWSGRPYEPLAEEMIVVAEK